MVKPKLYTSPASCVPCAMLEGWLEANGMLGEVEIVNLDKSWGAAPKEVTAIPTLEAEGKFITGVEPIVRYLLGKQGSKVESKRK